MLPTLPPAVEGRIPTEEEMEFKARNGRYYLEDVWAIVREFPSADYYGCHTNLPGLVNTLFTQVRDIGYELKDSSEKLNECHHALELTMAWAQVVREARTTQTMHIVRRTPENSGAMLMIQRQEHLRGQCTEWAPVAFIALVRHQQFVVTRDRVLDQAATERLLIQFAKGIPATPADDAETGDAANVVEADSLADASDDEADSLAKAKVNALAAEAAEANMPNNLFNQQIASIKAMLDAMSVADEACKAEGEHDADWEDVESEGAGGLRGNCPGAPATQPGVECA